MAEEFKKAIKSFDEYKRIIVGILDTQSSVYIDKWITQAMPTMPALMDNIIIPPTSSVEKFSENEVRFCKYWYNNEKLWLTKEYLSNLYEQYFFSEGLKRGFDTFSFLGKLDNRWHIELGETEYALPEDMFLNGDLESNKSVKPPTEGARYVDSPEYKSILKPFVDGHTAPEKAETHMSNATPKSDLVPAIRKGYRPFGFYKDMLDIVQSEVFFPVYVYGDTGYGKTTMIEQSYAVAGKELIRVPITSETDKTSLLVIPQLTNGTLEYIDGPVLVAMKQGAGLLLDEIDRGTEKLMCLQGIMEGKPYFNERKQETVYPAPGFNIIATGNSKGQGGDARYVLNILDDAFLDRFAITVVHNAPFPEVEKEILYGFYESQGKQLQDGDDTFIETLIRWAKSIRNNFEEGSAETAISTRRLLDILQAYFVFGQKRKALSFCLNRFNEVVGKSFEDLYEAMDLEVQKEADAEGITDKWRE